MNSDLLIQQRVIDELAFEPSVNAAHIGVSVHTGVVTLSGHVASYVEKFAAERAARRVKGVSAVAQDLEVRLPSDRKTADDEIAARTVQILHWDALLPDNRIQVKVERGTVTLTGEVDWNYQREDAEYVAARLSGVKAVINEIRVAPAIKAEDVQATIRAALERIAETEAKRVAVNVSGSRVTLTGTVAASSERDAIERAAWSAPGVAEVDNRIEIA